MIIFEWAKPTLQAGYQLLYVDETSTRSTNQGRNRVALRTKGIRPIIDMAGSIQYLNDSALVIQDQHRPCDDEDDVSLFFIVFSDREGMDRTRGFVEIGARYVMRGAVLVLLVVPSSGQGKGVYDARMMMRRELHTWSQAKSNRKCIRFDIGLKQLKANPWGPEVSGERPALSVDMQSFRDTVGSDLGYRSGNELINKHFLVLIGHTESTPSRHGKSAFR